MNRAKGNALIFITAFFWSLGGLLYRMVDLNAVLIAGVTCMIAYVIMGICIVVASLFQMGYTGSSSDSTGTGFEMNVIVALVLGGMPLSGGMRSKVSCAIVGSFTLAVLTLGLPMIGMAANQVFCVKAIIFLIVVLITCRKGSGTLPR